MYYTISTDDKYAFYIEKFENEEDALKDIENLSPIYDYRAIIKGEIIFEEKKYQG